MCCRTDQVASDAREHSFVVIAHLCRRSQMKALLSNFLERSAKMSARVGMDDSFLNDVVDKRGVVELAPSDSSVFLNPICDFKE